MAYSDPQVITINSIANSFARVGQGINAGSFQTADGAKQLVVAHSYGRRIRRTARLNDSKVVADALVPSQNTPVSMSAYLVVDTPLAGRGYSTTEQLNNITGFLAWLTATSNANIVKLLGGES